MCSVRRQLCILEESSKRIRKINPVKINENIRKTPEGKTRKTPEEKLF